MDLAQFETVVTILERIALALERPTHEPNAAPATGQAGGAGQSMRERKEAEYAPPLSDDEFMIYASKIRPGRCYKPGDLAILMGDPAKGKRIAYWLSRRNFWSFSRKQWGYIKNK